MLYLFLSHFCLKEEESKTLFDLSYFILSFIGRKFLKKFVEEERTFLRRKFLERENPHHFNLFQSTHEALVHHQRVIKTTQANYSFNLLIITFIYLSPLLVFFQISGFQNFLFSHFSVFKIFVIIENCFVLEHSR